ncbi:M23 family metallopeptidase [Streptomyces sp. B1I3]|uniref:M23 family metallopeptidase n=1 Tax=Streptomyces sp. B1I3 TaxID=3042264 RepID=UPI002786D20F|nr:M23 family metallopeptidase [Streptomyces sp. B1I3]MDQ0794456.1 murein DD-endopeptidase MepM/ murein hydrolase activator NlpD [Streptomyces sp. B1I3]
MNDQHPHAGYVGYDSHSTGSFDTDPLFGTLPGHPDNGHETYDGGYATAYDGADTGYSTAYPAEPSSHTGSWDTGAHQQASYDAYGAQTPPQAQPGYETTATTATWMPEAGIPAQAAAHSPDATGQWDTTGWENTGQADQWATGDTGAFPTTTFSSTAYATGTYAVPAFEASGYGTTDTGAYDATAWNTGATPDSAAYTPEQTSQTSYEHQSPSYESYESHESYASEQHAAQPYETEQHAAEQHASEQYGSEPYEARPYEPEPYGADAPGSHGAAAGTADAEADSHAAAGADAHDAGTGDDPDTRIADVTVAHASVAARPVGRAAQRGGSRGRRRTPAKRSALLTVAVPSACVMSVAGIAAASVSGVGADEEKKDASTSMAAADTVKPVVANNKLDTQLANLSADAENFADRASRTQERIDLRERQAAEKQKREEEAARREAARPKFLLPVGQHGLSAYYGQAGVNWMSVHTGIDFPVSYGTPVMAATDGTVRTQWNSAYGNMAIVTSPDGTETWYCHLSSTKIRSGSVKAGDVIAYSGNSGNSTGPHLHFEVRPGGGSAIDPMPWLRSHGLNPN